jgi:hypothetical protein
LQNINERHTHTIYIDDDKVYKVTRVKGTGDGGNNKTAAAGGRLKIQTKQSIWNDFILKPLKSPTPYTIAGRTTIYFNL